MFQRPRFNKPSLKKWALSLGFTVLSLSAPAHASDPALPWLIGHRGMGANHAPEPENSLRAIEQAFKLGVDAVEFDVQLSSDGETVLAHDPRLERISDAEGCVAAQTMSQLAGHKLRDGKGNVHADQSMATLSEALAVIRPYDRPERPFLANIHIKVYDGFLGDMSGPVNGGCPPTRYDLLTSRVLGSVRAAGLQDRVIFTSFDERVLDQIKAEYPRQRVGLLTWIGTKAAIEKAPSKHYEFVSASKDHLFAEDVTRAHALGIRVLAWTSEDQQELIEESKLGIDGWITDDVHGAIGLTQVCK